MQFTGLMILSTLLRYPPYFLLNTVFYVFQERDLLRALGLLNGNFIFFGSELTGGGNLPGPFYYLLLSPPLAPGLGWMGVCMELDVYSIIFWWRTGLVFFPLKIWYPYGVFWLILYSLAMPLTQLIHAFLNPSFSILFIVLANIYTLNTFSENSPVKRDHAFIV